MSPIQNAWTADARLATARSAEAKRIVETRAMSRTKRFCEEAVGRGKNLEEGKGSNKLPQSQIVYQQGGTDAGRYK